jgi:hypothetical protein
LAWLEFTLRRGSFNLKLRLENSKPLPQWQIQSMLGNWSGAMNPPRAAEIYENNVMLIFGAVRVTFFVPRHSV